MPLAPYPIQDSTNLLVEQIIQASKWAAGNPTLSAVRSTLSYRLDAGVPITFLLTNCINKPTEIFLEKDRFLSFGKKQSIHPAAFSRGVQQTGWARLRSLIQLCQRRAPVSVTLCIGDADYWTVLRTDEWCSPAALEALEREILLCAADTQQKADSYFGSGIVRVCRWSALYDRSDFQEALKMARDPNRWVRREEMVRKNQDLLVHGWQILSEYRSSPEFSSEKLTQLLTEELERSAAQYHLEGTIAATTETIQLWAERMPDPLWPLNLTNYDGRQPLPSLFLA